jgi:hypothetical protein
MLRVLDRSFGNGLLLAQGGKMIVKHPASKGLRPEIHVRHGLPAI